MNTTPPTELIKISEEQLESVLQKLPARTVIQIEGILRQQGLDAASVACFEALSDEETVIVRQRKHKFAGRLGITVKETLTETFICFLADQGREIMVKVVEIGAIAGIIHGNFTWLQEAATSLAPSVATSGIVLTAFTVGGTIVGSFVKNSVEDVVE